MREQIHAMNKTNGIKLEKNDINIQNSVRTTYEVQRIETKIQNKVTLLVHMAPFV